MDTDSTDNYDQVESTIQPEEAPEQPLELPKPKKKGRPPGAKDAYKRTRKSSTTEASRSAPIPAPQDNAFHQASGLAVDRYEQPMGVDMNTLADLMIHRMTVRASDARAQKTKHWDKYMPNSK